MGFFDVAACVAPYVRGNLRVVLSHGHYDHACGQHYFGKVYVHPDDMKLCRRAVGRENRKRTLNRLRGRGFLGDNYPDEQFLGGTPDAVKPLTEFTMQLGGLEVRFLHTPGHTRGSIVAYIPERGLLLTGDMWNPHVWLFFPECQPLSVYTQSMKSLHGLQAEHVLCPHDIAPTAMSRIRAYIDGLNERTFAQAEPCSVPPYTRYPTFRCYPESASELIFNGEKRT